MKSPKAKSEWHLPNAPDPVANYQPFKLSGDIAYLSGQGPLKADGTYCVGRVGLDVSAKDAYQHARLAGQQLLAVAKEIVGDLDRIEVLKVFGMVNAEACFSDHPGVIDGCSDLFVEVLGDSGRHARSAVGMNSLPNGMTVEVEAIVRIRPPSVSHAALKGSE